METIALCLSGGGLRATLFHLGVIRALRFSQFDTRPAIRAVSEIYSVSGGSILAAHMAVRWNDYIGSDAAFQDAEQELLSFAQRNIRDRILRRSALTFLPLRIWNLVSSRHLSGRTYWLQREYEALLGNSKLPARDNSSGGRPSIHLLSTNFITGEMCSFSNDRFEIERTNGDLLETPCGNLTLSRAVAASSAFPPLFPPMIIDDAILSRPRDEAFLQPILLTDGGVFDNLGIEKYWRNRKRYETTPRTLVISNAGSPFRSDASKAYTGPLSRNVRASDILMRRVGDHAERAIAAATDTCDIALRLTDEVKGGTLDETIQQPLRLVRTDLDRFDSELAQLLVEHGKEVGRKQFGRCNWPWTGPEPQLSQAAEDLDRKHRVASRAASRSFWRLPFDVRDWWPLLLLWAVFTAILLSGFMIWRAYADAQAAEGRALEAKLKLADEQQAKLAEATEALRANDIPRLGEVLLGALDQAQAARDETMMQIATSGPPPLASADVVIPDSAVTYMQPVYLQFAGLIKREQIVALNRGLRDNGWNVQGPSGERIATAANQNEVRYAGENGEAAERLAAAISAAGITSKSVVARRVEIVGPTNLEAWISY